MLLATLQSLLDQHLHAAVLAAKDDQNGIFLPSERPVSRLGLALEPFAGLEKWIEAENLDALFLHRPWGMTGEQRAFLMSQGIGVLAYHLAFDERLTTGFNPTLAQACGWGAPELFGEKEGRPLGMTCPLPIPTPFGRISALLEQQFGGLEDVINPSTLSVTKIAVVGAMTDALVRRAHAEGVNSYVTGQLRRPAMRAVEETGIGVIALGHHRSEKWGLHRLADQLRETSGEKLQVVLAEII